MSDFRTLAENRGQVRPRFQFPAHHLRRERREPAVVPLVGVGTLVVMEVMVVVGRLPATFKQCSSRLETCVVSCAMLSAKSRTASLRREKEGVLQVLRVQRALQVALVRVEGEGEVAEEQGAD